MARFVDRRDAGRQLAARLIGVAGDRALVLALPRGGVPIGYEVALALNAELDIWVVRKVGAPWNPELGLGAVAEGGFTYVNRELVAALGMSEEQLLPLIDVARRELDERVRLFRTHLSPPALTARDVIVVDDGVATGGSLLVALRSVAAQRPRSVTVAVPVAAPEVLPQLAELANSVVCLQTPSDLKAVGFWYEDFTPIADGHVSDVLSEVSRDIKRPNR